MNHKVHKVIFVLYPSEFELNMTSSPSNTFTSAFQSTCNRVHGDNGGLKNRTSGDSRVDCFTNFSKDTSVENIRDGINKMLAEVEINPSMEERGVVVADIFRLWCHKRHAREGEKEKLLSYRYFLELYELFPKTCVTIASSNLFGTIGYWKDPLLIWGLINKMELTDEERFSKYDNLIKGFRCAMNTQRLIDLRKLSTFISPHKVGTISCEELEKLLKTKSSNGESVSVSYMGKYCVREKSTVNTELYWFIRNEDGKLERESHVSYVIRSSLKRKIVSSEGVKSYEPFPSSQSVPFGAKKDYRTLNARLNVVLNVPEVLACAKRFSDMNPEHFPSVFMKRNSKFLLNEKLKVKPSGNYEEERGNRDPSDEGRVELRQKMRDMFRDPSKVNSSQVFPHEIACSAYLSSSTAHGEMQQALWDSKILETQSKLDELRSKLAEELIGSGVSENDIMVRKALTSGRFIGCADVSPSMTWVDKYPNRPLDIASGLTCFLSQIACDDYKDLALSFTTEPSVFNFKNGSAPMSVKERMTHIMRYSGGSTNYKGLHSAVLSICKSGNVKAEDVPVIVVFTDGEFDTMDTSLSGYSYVYGVGYTSGNSNKGSVESKWKTIHEEIETMWVNAGYTKIPTIVYWNLNSNSNGVQSTSKYPGVQLLQGRSATMIKYILYGEAAEETTKEVDGVKVTTSSITPYETFRKCMDQDHFSELDAILKESTEGQLKYYV